MIIDLKTITYKDRPVFEKMVITPQAKRIPKEFRENEACFLLLNQGKFQLRTPTKALSFDKGDAMLSKCGNYFIENHENNTENLRAIAVYFYPDITKRFFDNELSMLGLRDNFDSIKVDVGPWLRSFMDSIDFLIDHPGMVHEVLVENKLKELLLLLAKTVHAGCINDFVSSLFAPFEYDFKEIVQQNIFTNLSIDELAKLTNSSISTFKRRFSKIFNDSPGNYIRKRRLEKALSLLMVHPLSIAEIAFECGFENTSSFTKTFKKQMGMTPTTYRMQKMAG